MSFSVPDPRDAGVPMRPGRLTRRRSLRGRLGALLAVGLALLVAIGTIALIAVRTQDRDLAAIRETLSPARVELGILQGALLDQQSSVRGIVLSAQNGGSREPFEAAYEAAREDEQESLARLEALLADEPGLMEETTAVGDADERWTDEAAEPALAAVEAGDPETALEIVETRGALIFAAAVRPALAELRDSLDAELADRDDALSDANRRLAIVLVVSILLILLGFLGGLVLLRRWFTRPIARLDDAVARVAGGELDHTIPEAGPNEIARLGASVDSMRRRILTEGREAIRAREALSQQALAVRAVEQALEPAVVEFPPGLEIAGRVRPAEGVLAGDWYEFVDLGPSRTAFAVADVAGHGVVPGVVALRAKQLVGAGIRMGMDPGEFLEWMNAELGDMGEFFLTIFVGIVDVEERTCQYANAGHPAGAVLAEAGLQRLGPTGPLMAGLNGTWTTAAASLPDPSLLVVATDGVIDARDATHTVFGEDRFLSCFRFERGQAGDLADYCLDQVGDFVQGELTDDATIVVIRLGASDARRTSS